ncbi:helix-hairpin-helix domain-containing protein [Candidatus Marithrix sp. Canyon 246]|uniref:helix-hairpin-helix domain-containing protein n=2 Tax=Candidatus Marithrix sp. Canyon 246 TaxID=1827136 RepID=UPI002A4E2935|nr:OB-fold nucleic acid binding domain-containing protein [Candidatus Marithrix sp. Canyon 246]
MGKKVPAEMAEQRTIFLKGAAARNVDEQVATSIFDLMEKFAAYGFNLSHSAAYALVSYQTAWLKAHYPAAFMAAVLSADLDNTDKVVMLVDECRAMKLKILPPNINLCDYKFTVVDNEDLSIYYGLGAIKGAGEAALESIVAERQEHGTFSDLFDFCNRIDLRKVSKRLLEPLIKSGAFDDLGPNRAITMASLNTAIKTAEQNSSNTAAGQNDIFGNSTSNKKPEFVKDVPNWNETLRLNKEKESLGFYLSGHPITPYLPELKRIIHTSLANIKPTERKKTVRVAGWLMDVRVNTKRGRMAFLSLDDNTARIDVKVYSEVYNQVSELLVKDTLLIIDGSVRSDDYTGGYSMTAQGVSTLEIARENLAKSLEIYVSNTSDNLAEKIVNSLTSHRDGKCPVTIHYKRQDAKVDLQLNWRIKPDTNLVDELKNLLGEDQVKVIY